MEKGRLGIDRRDGAAVGETTGGGRGGQQAAPIGGPNSHPPKTPSPCHQLVMTHFYLFRHGT